MSEFLDAALQYAERGFAVLPLKPRGKEPLTAHGCHDATTDERMIRQWWKQYPDANVGIAAGTPSRGLVVIDVDNDKDKGKDGSSYLRKWESKNGSLPETVTCLTGSGGEHYYYLDPDGHYGNDVCIIEDVDIRTTGGYVVAPPSVHPNGNRYEWEADHELTGFLPAPANDVVRKFRNRPEPLPERPSVSIDGQIFTEGTRVQSLVAMIGSLVRKGLSEAEIRAAVSVANEQRCSPPLTDKDLDKNVFPALKRGWKIEAPFWEEKAQLDIELPKPFSFSEYFANPPALAPVLIDGVLRRGHKMVLSGPSKAGKSFALAELCVAIAEGQTWFGNLCMRGKVLYINMEIDRRSCINRFKKVYEAKALNVGAHPGNIDMWCLRGYAQPISQLVDKIIEAASKNDYLAIVIDPLYKVMEGDENSNSDISKMVSFFDRIAQKTGAAVIYAHHFAKGNGGDRDVIDRAAGAGTFARDPDAIVTMTQIDWTPERDGEHGLTAWRIEYVLREFQNMDPYDVLFKYPLHIYAEDRFEGCSIVTTRSKQAKRAKEASEQKDSRQKDDIEGIIEAISDKDGRFLFRRFFDWYKDVDKVSEQTARRRLKENGYGPDGTDPGGTPLWSRKK